MKSPLVISLPLSPFNRASGSGFALVAGFFFIAALRLDAQPLLRFTDSGQRLIGRGTATAVELGDLDNDGDLDAVIANSGGADKKSQVWINQGALQGGIAGRFEDSGQELANGFSLSVALADLDGDGDLDAFFTGTFSSPDSVQVWINQGGAQTGNHGTFLASGQLIGVSESSSISLGNLDAFPGPDGLFTAALTSPGPSTIWTNNGAGQFANSGQQFGNELSRSATLGDLDGDGDLDAVVVSIGADSPDRIWINQGGAQGGSLGTFQDSGQIFPSRFGLSVAAGDLDRDGDLDIVIGGLFSSATLVNQGGRQGGTAGVFSASSQSISAGNDVALADLDRDGDLDLFLAKGSGSNRIYQNDGAGNLTEANLPIGEGATASVALGDLDLDGDPDAVVANVSAPHEVWLNETLTIYPRISPSLTPGRVIDFGTFAPTFASSLYSTVIYLANTGNTNLVINSMRFARGGSQGLAFLTRSYPSNFLTIAPHVLTNAANHSLSVEIQFLPDTEPRRFEDIFEIVSNDPITPVIRYPIHYRIEPDIEGLLETTIAFFFSRGLFPPESREPGDRMTIFAALELPGEVTLELSPDEPHSVSTQVPAFLGGGSVVFSNFTGSVNVSLLPITNLSDRSIIRVNSGRFTAPSFRLPSGIETGPNTLTFASTNENNGVLNHVTGEYTATAAATIVNSLFPQGFPVRGSYSGAFNPATGRIAIQSQSTDLIARDTLLRFSRTAEALDLTWNSGVLEHSTNSLTSWTTLTNASSPFRVNTTIRQRQFFRLKFGP